MSSRLPIAEKAASARWIAARARAWLRTPAIVDSEGAVRSWDNPRHPGFDYPEVAGLWLSAFAGGDRGRDPIAARVAERLAARVLAGEVGREGVGYTFDLGVALAGLHDHARAGGPDHTRARAAARSALLSALDRRRATDIELPPRWSTRYGPHLLKLAAVLARMPGPQPRAAAGRLFDDLAPSCDAGRWLTAPDGGATYLHAHCYAAEGAWCIATTDPDRVRAREATRLVTLSADWLADAQGAGGGLPSHHDGRHGCGPARADATAQAIRIWAAVDARRHGAAIAAALRWLDAHATVESALRYEPGSDDLNTWATIFALQAHALVTAPSGSRELPW